jgi:hypothetical protein
VRCLAGRYGINPKTVVKWKQRTPVKDLPAGPKEVRSSVLSVEEEAVAVAFRRQWPKLIRFVDNGHWPLDTNPVENAIRPFVVGRKGWLFADTVGGANASANLYSLIETAKANGIEPYRYLVALFKKLPPAQTADDYEALLPWNINLTGA